MANRLVVGQRKMARRKSPKDSKCPHCGRHFTKGGLKQHLRHVKCSPTSTASPRKFERVRCKHCSKSFHSTNSLRVHVSTVHPNEYAKSPGHMKNHRAPYHKKRHSSDWSGGGSNHHRGSSARASSRALSEVPPPPSRADGRSESVRRSTSGGERRESHHHSATIGSRDRDADRQSAWQSEMKKRMAEAVTAT